MDSGYSNVAKGRARWGEKVGWAAVALALMSWGVEIFDKGSHLVARLTPAGWIRSRSYASCGPDFDDRRVCRDSQGHASAIESPCGYCFRNHKLVDEPILDGEDRRPLNSNSGVRSLKNDVLRGDVGSFSFSQQGLRISKY